ncbi:MAG: PfkB family carbohydrate kinase [Candidatus Nanopelagicales bacterium]
MTARPAIDRLLDQFPWGRVLVVGDVVADEWLTGACGKVAREAPVPNVSIRYREVVPGGGGNTAVNVTSLGGRCVLMSALGDDAVGEAVAEQLRRRGVQEESVVVCGRHTIAKRRIVVGPQVVARFDEGDVKGLDPEADAELAGKISQYAQQADVVVVADYGLGSLEGPQVQDALAGLSRPVLVDAHDVRRWARVRPEVVTPNWEETAGILRLDPGLTGPLRIEQVRAGADLLREATGSTYVVATLDGDGALLVAPDAVRHVPTRRVDAPHSAGAGDTLTAALALGLAVGADLTDALELAVAAATVVVQRPGTATCSPQDLRSVPGSPLLTAEELIRICHEHRAAGRRIAVTNGCFDVLHAGHVSLLQSAAAEADVLVVALNDDAGVRAIKGPGRPVNGVADRAAVLAAMGFVDHLTAYDGAAPLSLIDGIRPDVYVKGADHDVLALPEARATTALGGRVSVVPLLPDRSTSGVIEACARARSSA